MGLREAPTLIGQCEAPTLMVQRGNHADGAVSYVVN
jgi:hypothetical protein